MTDDRASGADDVAIPLYAGGRLRKLRFLMTDNTLNNVAGQLLNWGAGIASDFSEKGNVFHVWRHTFYR